MHFRTLLKFHVDIWSERGCNCRVVNCSKHQMSDYLNYSSITDHVVLFTFLERTAESGFRIACSSPHFFDVFSRVQDKLSHAILTTKRGKMHWVCL